jgi:hypothetical protein
MDFWGLQHECVANLSDCAKTVKPVLESGRLGRSIQNGKVLEAGKVSHMPKSFGLS